MKDGELLEGQAISEEAKREAQATLEKAGMRVRTTGDAPPPRQDTAPFDGRAPASAWTTAKKAGPSPAAPAQDPLEKAAESLRDVPQQLAVPITHLQDAKESLARAGFAVSTNPGVEPQVKPPRSPESERITNPSVRTGKKERTRVGWIVGAAGLLVAGVVFFLLQGSQPANGDQGADPPERLGATTIATATVTAMVAPPPTAPSTATTTASERPSSSARTTSPEKSSDPRPPRSAKPSSEPATATAPSSKPSATTNSSMPRQSASAGSAFDPRVN